MKRSLVFMVLVAVLMVPTVGFAQGDQIGVYVSPKFVYGFTQMNNVKGIGLGSGDPEPTTYPVGDKDDNVFGGSLAIGYDFEKRFGVPIRTELEYSIFSKAEAKKNYSHGEFIPGEDLTRKQAFDIQTWFLNAYMGHQHRNPVHSVCGCRNRDGSYQNKRQLLRQQPH